MQFLFILLLLGGITGGAYFYYTDTQETIAELQQNNAALLIASETNQETINRLQEDYVVAQKNIITLQERAMNAERYQDELINKLRRHDLTALTMKKPGMVEKRINDATNKIFEQLEIDSGKPQSIVGDRVSGDLL
jgi:soluble P-type ATPase